MTTLAKKIRTSTALIIFFVLIFFAYTFLSFFAPRRAASPDENVNSTFAALFADTTQLRRDDALNHFAAGLIHPRSTRVVDTFVVPGGFLGLPVLYGGIAKAFGKAVLPFLTPCFALFAIFAWWQIVQHFFDKKISVAATLLLIAHPVWWYETARTFQPNVLFASLTILAAWFLFTQPMHRALGQRTKFFLFQNADAPLGGMFAALALGVRTSEAYWFGIVAIVLLVFSARKISWHRFILFILFTALAFTPFLFLNTSVYGNVFATGYGTGIVAPGIVLPQGKGAMLLGPLGKYLFPLGFAPRTALHHFITYGITFFWWWSILVAASLVALAWEAIRVLRAGGHIPRAAIAFGVTAVTVSFWLVLFYGSWTVQDNPDPGAITIGSSYLRYWLPIFIFSTVPVGWLVARAAAIMTPARRRAFYGIFFLLFLLSSASDVFLSPQEGLLALRQSLFAEDTAAQMIVTHTEPDALVVVDRADKFVFPERRVLYPLRSDDTYAALSKLKQFVPMYYFGITFPETDLRWLREVKLPPLGLTIEPAVVAGEETLYRFVKL